MAMIKFALILYLSLVLAVAASSNADAFGRHRRDHADLGRLVKKRTPLDVLGNEASPQGQQTPSVSSLPSQGSSAGAQTTPANSASVQSASAATTSAVSRPSQTYEI